MTALAHAEPWRRRLYLPNYQVKEAARYARVTPKTVADLHKVGSRQTLSPRQDRVSLSYMQLIEVAVVAAFGNAGHSIKHIRETREYVVKQFESEFHFVEYRFKSYGKRLVMDCQQIEGESGKGKVLRPDPDGQLAWEVILGRLNEFEYEHQGIIIRWHVTGPKSPIVIDHRIAFGAPNIKWTPTWSVSGRWNAGESVRDIADDFDLDLKDVREALMFEGIQPDGARWRN